jgi:RNase P subunit RPR2
MLVRVKINDSLWLEEEVTQEVEAFKAAARLTEIFQHPTCGKCNSKNVQFVCRKDSSENDWLEIVCQECFAKLVFSQTKKGGLVYPKKRWDDLSVTQKESRADEEAHAEDNRGYLPNGGWYHFKKAE